MNFSFYIFGTPNGYNQYPADINSGVFQECYQNRTTESQLTVKRSGQLVFYIYLRQLHEKSNNFLGFCLVFNGIYCRNPKKIFKLFEHAYFDVQMKGEFLKFDKEESNYVINKFTEKSLEIERIKTFFKNNLEKDFIYDFTNTPLVFKFGNGSKIISINENDADILSALAEYEIVHISNNEKSLSELERTQKILSELYVQKRTLQQDYNKLLAKKKQYGIVIALCLILLGCGTGLLIFNRNLQNRDILISELNQDMLQKKSDIKILGNENTRLWLEQQKLVNTKKTLLDSISIVTTKNNELTATVDQLQSDIDIYKKYEPIRYRVIYEADFYYKYRCNESYVKTDCHLNSDRTTLVYKISNDYGLTDYGWIKMSYLSISQ